MVVEQTLRSGTEISRRRMGWDPESSRCLRCGWFFHYGHGWPASLGRGGGRAVV